MSPNAPFQFGERKRHIRIGLSTESAEYRLNHRINVWDCIDSDAVFPDGHTFMINDSLFKESFLFITNPDGETTKVASWGGGQIDGMDGVGWRGGASDHLHYLIRKVGTYKLQWKIHLKTGDLESGVITFKVVP